MKKIINFLRNINTFFISVILIITLGYLSIELISDLNRNSRSWDGVEVIEPQDLDNETIITRSFVNPEKNGQIIMYEVITDKIIKFDEALFNKSMISSSYSKSNGNRVVNILFHNIETSKSKLLLPKDSLITNYILSDQKTIFSLSRNIYLIVTKDTNDDNYFTADDSKDLYVSDYDGSNLLKLAEDINSFRVIQDNELVFYTVSKPNMHYYYNTNNKEVKLLFDGAEF